MSSPTTIPALQAGTLNAIHTYLSEAAAGLNTAAQTGDLAQRAAAVDAIFQSVMTNCQSQLTVAGKAIKGKTLDGLMDAKAPNAVKISGTETVFDYNALRATVVAAHQTALQTIAAQQQASLAPSPTRSEQEEPPAPQPFEFPETPSLSPQTVALPPSDTTIFGTQLGTAASLPAFDFSKPFDFSAIAQTGPFVFGTPIASPRASEQGDKPAAGPQQLVASSPAPQDGNTIRAEFPVVEEEESPPSSQKGDLTAVPTLDLSLVGQSTNVQVDATARSQAPSPSEDGSDVSGNEIPGSKQGSRSNSPAQADRKEEQATVAKPDDVLVEDDEEEAPSRCRPGRKTACTAVTAALGGVGFFFKDALVQAGSTVVLAAQTHGPALWNGVREAATTHGSALWNGVKETVLTGGYRALNATLEQCESDEDVAPGLPGVKPKHVVAATVAASAAAFVVIGYCATRVTKPKAE